MLQAVKGALSSGYLNIQKTLEYQRVKTYWTIGKEIHQRVEASQDTLSLNEALYQRISKDIQRLLGLSLTPDTICRSIQFAKTYPEFPDKTPLTFTHYLALMRIANTKQRTKLERQAIKEDMAASELKEKVAQLNTRPAVLTHTNTHTLSIERGEPYVYAARPFEDLSGKQNMCVDCGFKIHVPIKGAIIKRNASFSKDKWRTVRVIKEDDDYDVRLAARKSKLIYTYAARVLRVVDGDTLDALIDVGFGIRIQERFRLKAINAPEIKTRAGQKAAQFLTDTLSKSPILVVRTSKAGMYGRWLGDLFVMPGTQDPRLIAAEGDYLNQMLLDQGLAERY